MILPGGDIRRERTSYGRPRSEDALYRRLAGPFFSPNTTRGIVFRTHPQCLHPQHFIVASYSRPSHIALLSRTLSLGLPVRIIPGGSSSFVPSTSCSRLCLEPPMWLLSTDRAELHYFPSPEQVPDGYATLSHVWDKEGEQTFQDIRKIQEDCKKDGRNPRTVVCKKIRRCCRLAEQHGYQWVWIDTCCIDKTSSAELSEAINSMFHYYSLAIVCYGYLRDVDDPPADNREILTLPPLDTTSVWFIRGWTLQELIAPHLFLFVSRSWKVLGTKADYAELLEETTGIPAAVLRLELSYTIPSIAQRMSWIGDRKTTRVEDEAYCLLGLFGIHMPTLYGEGRNAFQRLQEEIMRQSVDTTLFAWMGREEDPESCSCLFAPSPSAFQLFDDERQWKIEYTPPRLTRLSATRPSVSSPSHPRSHMMTSGSHEHRWTYTVSSPGSSPMQVGY